MKTEKLKTVTKAELANHLSQLGVSQRFSRKVVDFMIEQVVAELEKGEIIHLVGFGAFHYKYRNPRRGRNPRTGGEVAVPMKRVIHFRPSSYLKQLVRE